MTLIPRQETKEERAANMARCSPYDCKVTFLERPGSENRCEWTARILAVSHDAALRVALASFKSDRKVKNAGMVLDCTADLVRGKGNARTLALTPTTAALFGRKP